MAMLFADSFDHYTSMLQKWSLFASSGSIGATPTGRFGNGYINPGNAGAGGAVTKILGGSRTTLFLGVAIQRASGPVSGFGSNWGWVAFGENTVEHIDLRFNGTNFFITRAGTTLATGTAIIAANVWYYVELKVNVHDTTGSVVVKINGVTDINFSGGDTRNGGTGIIDRFRIGGEQAFPNYTVYYDDLVVMDDVDQSIADANSPPNNDFLGDIRVEALFPSGNGNSSQLVGSDSNSTDNYLLVDETAPNSDTDYVESSTPGDKDTYAMGNLTPASGTVYGIQVLPFARKTDAGARSIVSVVRLSGAEHDGPVQVLSSSYQYLPNVLGTDPAGNAWTVANINSMEAGVKVDA